MKVAKPSLSVEIAGIKMKNPVAAASGTFGFGLEYAPFVDLNRLGAVFVKGITRYPQPGNPPPRLVETPAGVLNAIGLQNPGVEKFGQEILPALRPYDLPVIVNIAGTTVDDYAFVAASLDGLPGVAGLEINISCPNVRHGGMAFGVDPASAAQVVGAVREVTGLPLIVKLTPNVTDIVAVAGAVMEAGADALSMINTLLGMSIDVRRRRPALANITGGLSGPAIRPVAVRAVWEVYRALKVPIVGMGGIATAQDALEFIMAGATAVAVGTANLFNPRATVEVIEGLERFLVEEGIGDIRELIGVAHGERGAR